MTKPAIVDKTDLLESLLAERILVLDGAMGTQIQALGFDERAVRGERFADHHKDLKNFADILCLTHPDDDHGDPPPLPGGRGRHRRDEHVRRQPVGMEEFELPRELVREINAAAVALCPPGRATSSTSARPTGRGSSPARSARRPSRWRSARRSMTPAIAA